MCNCSTVPPASTAPSANLPFPMKLHDMLSEAEQRGFENIVSWLPDGKRFQIHDPETLATEVLGIYFRQTKYKSFLRQLQNYGFVRTLKGHEKGTCQHDLFTRKNRRDCLQIKRATRSLSSPVLTKIPTTAVITRQVSESSTPSSQPAKQPSLMSKMANCAFPMPMPSSRNSTARLFQDKDILLLPSCAMLTTSAVCTSSTTSNPEEGFFEGKRFFVLT